jgi:hypothetical protein
MTPVESPHPARKEDSMSTVASSGELLLRPIVFTQPVRLVYPPSWVSHIPFAFWLTDALRPRTVVELGTHSGVSYSAFAQAVQILKLDAAAYAVDTWQGDHQAGFYGEDVYEEWASFHDHHFSAFSRLVRSTFDDALTKFPDGSVDLLHIDGLHTYEAVRHDFESWVPKLSNQAVVLMHDTNVREGDFGVWRFWAEVASQYPSFAFLHGHGLGVVGVGRSLPADVRWLVERVNSREQNASTVREFFARLGEALQGQLRDSAWNSERARIPGRLAEIERSAKLDAERRVAEAEAQVRAEAERRVAEAEAQARVEAERRIAEAQTQAYVGAERRVAEAQLQARAEAEHQVAGRERRVSVAQAQIRSDLEPRIAYAEHRLAETEARLRAETEQLQLECGRQQSEITALRGELVAIAGSTIWLASAPLRTAAGKLPTSLKTMARRGLQAVYWVITPWDTPKRLQYLRERQREQSGDAVSVTPPVDSHTDAPSLQVPEIVSDSPPPVTLRLHPEPRTSDPRRAAPSDAPAATIAATVICLSHVIPLPPRAGNEYRIHRMLTRLRQSGYRIVLVVSPLSADAIAGSHWDALAAAYGNVVHCDRGGQIRYRMDECPDVLAPLEGQRTPPYATLLNEVRPLTPPEAEMLNVDRSFCHDALIATLNQLQSSLTPCAVLAEYVWMTRGLPLLDPRLLTIVDTIDVFSTYQEKVGAFGIAGWHVRPEDEAQRLARAQVIVAIQPEEARILGDLAPGHELVTAGVDFEVVEGSDWPAKPVVFCVGSDNPRNLLGLRDFLKFAWPEIRRAVPDVRLAVAGSIGAAVPDSFPGVEVLGHVDDLDPEYRRARVVVNPAVAGTGLKIKTVEALSRLRPIVTWPNGIEGLPAEMAALVPPAQDWLDFAERVIGWLRSETAAFPAATAASIRQLLSSDHVYAGLEARLARYFDNQRAR